MEALVYHGPGERAWETVPEPAIQEPTDAVVKIDLDRKRGELDPWGA